MGSSTALFEGLAAWQRSQRAFVLATVTDTGGSTPRLAGAMMGITSEAQVGTVGGGAFELRVIEAARELLRDPARESATIEVHLVRDLGMCCGGRMVCFLNKIEVLPRLWVFGAGHVGTALAPIAQSAGFRVTVVDERVEWAVPSRFPGEVEVLDAEPTDLLRRQPLEPADYAVVVTHSHPLDEALIQAISSAPPAYVGLIGSRAKWARFRARLAERGVEPAFLDRVRCPVGADIGAATPGEIAVSIAAELVAVKRRVPQT